MCFQCDHPELSYGDYLEQVILPLVRDRGWAVQGVGGRRPFAYTVGLTEAGLPELVVTGLGAVAALVLDDVAGQLLRQGLRLGDHVPSVSGPGLVVIRVERPEDHLLTATAIYGDRVRGLQLVWPDRRGRYPVEPQTPFQRSRQPLLGPWPAP